MSTPYEFEGLDSDLELGETFEFEETETEGEFGRRRRPRLCADGRPLGRYASMLDRECWGRVCGLASSRIRSFLCAHVFPAICRRGVAG